MGSLINKFLLDSVAHGCECCGFDRCFFFKMLQHALTRMKFKEQPTSCRVQFLFDFFDDG